MLSDVLKQIQPNTEFRIVAEYPTLKEYTEYTTNPIDVESFIAANSDATRLLIQWPKSGKYLMVI
jgi:hypothetical protein